jgi:hypothetical protein
MDSEQYSGRRFQIGRRGLLTGVAALAAGGGVASLPSWAAASCPIGDATPNPNGWRVFRVANPPASNSQAAINAYTSWPVTDTAAEISGATTSTWTGGGPLNNWPINAWFYAWANRSTQLDTNRIRKANPLPGIPQIVNGYPWGVIYTTFTKANAATQCLIRYWLGRSDYMDPWLAISGASSSDFVYFYQLYNSPSSYFTSTYVGGGITYSVMVDRPWLPSQLTNNSPLFTRANMMPANPQYQDAPGVVLDYELGDYRSTGTGASASDPNGSQNFIQRIYNDVHATQDANGQAQVPGKLALWTDPLNAPSMPSSGLDATNLSTIANNYVDLLSVQLFAGNREGNIAASYMNQIGYLKGGGLNGVCSLNVPYEKLFLTIDVAGLSQSDAQFAYNLLAQGNSSSPPTAPPTVWFWQDGSALCSAQSNNMLSWVLQGSSATPTSLTYPTPYTGNLVC